MTTKGQMNPVIIEDISSDEEKEKSEVEDGTSSGPSSLNLFHPYPLRQTLVIMVLFPNNNLINC
jgi:hypothetical protein